MPLSSVVGAQSIIKPGVCTSSTRPAVPFEGQMIYETDTDLTYVYSGSAWQQFAGGTAVGNSGLVYVKSQTIGSAVSSVAVTSAFSTDYDNYKILINGGAGSTTSGLTFILTGSTTGYYQGNTTVRYDTGAVAGTGINNGAAFNIGRSNTDTIALSFELINPFLAKTTMISGAYNDTRGIAGTTANLYTGFHNVATSYTGFTITFDTGTFTGGTIIVYGYRK